MSNKTCGECRHYGQENFKNMCLWADHHRKACVDFALPTNGDVIRQGGNQALAQFKGEHKCDTCAYAVPLDHAPACQRPDGKTCFDGMLEWLNTPAESEVKDE